MMRNKILFIILIILFPVCSWAVNDYENEGHYEFGTWKGGSDNALDSVNGNNLSGGEIAWVNYEFGTDQRVAARYVLDADCSKSESGLVIISPDSNPGTKRWVVDVYPIICQDSEPDVPDGVTWIDTSQ